MPAGLQDNVRRGVKLVGSPGGTAPDFGLVMLYQLRERRRGRVEKYSRAEKQIRRHKNPAANLGWPADVNNIESAVSN